MSALVVSVFAQASPDLTSPPAPPSVSLTDAHIKEVQISKTYTYVRCWFRLTKNPRDPATNYEWATNGRNGDYYKLPGYWWSSISTKNMFYTDVTHQEILQKCKSTLGRSRADHDITFFAADNSISYNYEIWSNDQKQPTGINRMVTFGDSLSDTGNMFNASLWRFPNPYSWFVGHFSNGLVWTEYLSNKLGIQMNNWAVGGAAGDSQYLFLSGVLAQVDSYLEYMKLAKNYNPKNTLVTMEFGLNDFILYGRDVAAVKADMSSALIRLQSSGIENLLLMSLPDPATAPQLQFYSQQEREIITAKVKDFNHFLEQQAAYYQAQGLHVLLFKADELFNKIITHPADYGFTEARESCLKIDRLTNFDFFLSHDLRPKCIVDSPNRYVFWDLTHPTTAAHKLFATHIYPEALSTFTFSPEPSSNRSNRHR